MFFLSSFVNHQLEATELENILQAAFEVPIMENMLERSSTDEFLPIVLVANDLIPKDLQLEPTGKSVVVVEDKAAVGESKSVLVVHNLDASADRIKMTLRYSDNSKVSLRADKREGCWVLKRLSIKGPKGMWFYSDWGSNS
jgi:hypothetical protein